MNKKSHYKYNKKIEFSKFFQNYFYIYHFNVSKNYITNITKNFEFSKFFRNYFYLFYIYYFNVSKNYITNITKKIEFSKFILSFFEKNPSLWYDGENLV